MSKRKLNSLQDFEASIPLILDRAYAYEYTTEHPLRTISRGIHEAIMYKGGSSHDRRKRRRAYLRSKEKLK